MDQREIAIKKDIDETRAAMGEKINTIANRLHHIIVGPKLAADALIENLDQAQEAMQATAPGAVNGPNPVHAAVTDTVERVEAILHLLERTKREPWMMLSSALLMGYVIGCLNRGKVFTIRQVNSEVKNPGLQSPTSAALLP
jgi:hypothetical protein